MSDIHDLLKQQFPQLCLKSDCSWKNLTTIGIGGDIPLVAEPADDLELQQLLAFCHNKHINTFFLGNGSNVIGMDAPFPGLVIRLCRGDFVNIRCGRRHLTVGAGVKLRSLIRFAAEHGWGGISNLAGIPGSVGGAIRMNAGANGLNIGDKITEVFGFSGSGIPWSATAKEVSWQYRGSSIPGDIIVTGAIFELENADSDSEDAKVIEESERRRRVEPKGRNAGCVFKNPSADTHAGLLVDFAGCKGLRTGDLMVSNEHANYFVNLGEATENDFLKLCVDVQNKVFSKSGMYLKPEVRFANPASEHTANNACKIYKAAVLKGGASSEREVSLESGAAVAKALRACGYEVQEIDFRELKIDNRLHEVDFVFPVLHGGFGENGELQELLERENIEFVGCPSSACRVAMDKIASKEVMDNHAIPTPPWAVLKTADASLPEKLDFPLVCKPPAEGSTVGISLVKNQAQWQQALKDCLKFSPDILVEKYIKGREFTVGIVNRVAMTPVEIVYPGEMYDYDAKYTHANGETFYHCPPVNIPADVQERARKLALEFHNAIGARDMIRIDFIMDAQGDLYILEGNTIPGFTSSSLLPKSARAEGMSFEMLCARLARNAIERKEHRA